jgi:hypothetical protein
MPTTPAEPNVKTYTDANENSIDHGGYTPPAAIGRPPLPDQQSRTVPAERLGDAAREVGTGGGRVEGR